MDADRTSRARVSDGAQRSRASPAARRAFWMRQLHQWHWISSALSLAGMLLFAVTGITLNHAGQIEGAPGTCRTVYPP